MEKNRIFIGVAWPYVNGDLHIGHVAGYLLPSDIFARFSRLVGKEVLMVSGSDCFGTPITVEADKKNKTPKQIVRIYHKRNVDLFNNLGMTYDLYTKTDTPNHKKITQSFLEAFDEKELLTSGHQKQYYDEMQGRFLPDRYVEGICPYCGFKESRSDQCDNCGKLLEQNLINPKSKLTKNSVSLRDTEHIFIEWDKLEKEIEVYFNHKSQNWRNWVREETRGWLKTGLNKRAVTRDLDWGVEIPKTLNKKLQGSSHKRIYVWFDAVIGYYSASLEWSKNSGKDWKDFWYKKAKHYYFMGKDNLVFHTIFWPAQLFVFDKKLNLPDFPVINQYLNLNGQKFSKSRGVTIETVKFISYFGADSLRFYLCTIMPERSDSNFEWNDFLIKNNSLLVAQIGNYIHRTVSIYEGYSYEKSGKVEINIIKKCKQTMTIIIKDLESCEFKLYVEDLLSFAKYANKYFDNIKPWELKAKNNDEFQLHFGNLVGLAFFLAILVLPITPFASENFLEKNGFKNFTSWPKQNHIPAFLEGVLKKLGKLGRNTPLYKKFSLEDVAEFQKLQHDN